MRRQKIKAIVLAAGKGKRLKMLTQKIPKPMLRVSGEIILEHNLKWLKHNGITDIFINLHHLPQVIKNYFLDGRAWGLNIKYSFEKKLLGTAGAVRKILSEYPDEFKSGNFFVVYGDNFYPMSYNLKDVIIAHQKNKRYLSIGLYPNIDKANTKHCGVVLLGKHNLIKAFIEKPRLDDEEPRQDAITKEILKQGYLNAAVYLLNQKIMEFIPEGFSDFGREIFSTLIKNKVACNGYVFAQSLIAVDTFDLYKKANKMSRFHKVPALSML